MKSGKKLGNVKLIRIEGITLQDWYPNYKGTAIYKVRGIKKQVDFVASQNINHPYLVAFLNYGYEKEVPKEEQDKIDLQQLIYGEMSYLWGSWEFVMYIEKQAKELEEERKRQEEEERKKQVALGQQISIDNYLAWKNEKN